MRRTDRRLSLGWVSGLVAIGVFVALLGAPAVGPNLRIGVSTTLSSAVGAHRVTSASATVPFSVNLTGPDAILLGGVATFHAQTQGGSGPFSYRWIFNGSVGNWTNATTEGYRPLQDGIYRVNVSARNDTNVTAYAARNLLVTGPAPDQVTLRLVSVDGQGRATLQANVTGGTPPYRFEWVVSGTLGTWSNDSRFVTPPLHLGKDTLQVWVADQNDYRASSTLTVDYTVQPAAPSLWPYAGLGIGVAAGVAAGALVAVRRRRRRRAVPPEAPPPTGDPPVQGPT